MNKKVYSPRIIDSLLEQKLQGIGAIVLEGAKFCGKTTSAEQVAKSIVYMDDPDRKNELRTLAEIKPSKLLEGETPRLIDEWQFAPNLWDVIRFTVDRRGEYGQFILTGSTTPLTDEEENKRSHTGTGRFARLRMRPMTLFESNDSTGDVSLSNLFNAPDDIFGESDINIEKLSFLCCRGGWPTSCRKGLNPESALITAKEYFNSVISTEIKTPNGKEKNQLKISSFLKSYARNIGTQTSFNEIQKDCSYNGSESISLPTIYSYHKTLNDIFVIEEMLAWNPNLRSKAAIRTSNTRYFVDPSIATASLGISSKDLINDLQTFGFVFENLCMRDLRVYAQLLGGSVFHYRDSKNLECDAVIHLENGQYGLVEIKLGGETAIEQGVKILKQFETAIDTSKMQKPSLLMVLTGVGSFAYKRKDGVYVVPIGTLSP